MKIIEALKQIKYMTKKAEDIRQKLSQQCADMEFDQPQFPDMKAKIGEWLQAHTDIIRDIGRLKFRIQKTNVSTPLTINLNNTDVTKTLYEWVQRRKDLAALELSAYNGLTDKGLSDRQFQQTTGVPGTIKMRRYYDPALKAIKMEQLKFEPVAIDSALEIANCTIELLE